MWMIPGVEEGIYSIERNEEKIAREFGMAGGLVNWVNQKQVSKKTFNVSSVV